MPAISGNVGAVASVSSVFGRNGGVVAATGDYSGVVAAHLTGATAATRYVGGTASGAPVAGTFAVGDFVIEQTGKIYVCTVAGTPGTWVAIGGSSPVLSTTATLDNATIKALPTTSNSPPFGFEFLASPGPGTVLLPITGMLVKYGAAYTNVGANADLVLAYSGFNTSDMSAEVLCGGGNFLDTPLNETAMLPLTGWVIPAAVPPADISPHGFPSPLSALDGLGLILATNNSGDFTGGDPGNSLVIHLLYAVLTV